jgi:hypothetical protein
MRLTNRQQEIIIDEIYKQVSEPIIEANNKALDSVKIKSDQYQKDREKYLALQEKKNLLEEEMKKLEKPYERDTTFNGYKFNSWYSPFREEDYNNYIKHCKKQLMLMAEYPSRQDIEKELILSGNKDIPELIKIIVDKYKK